MKQIISYDSMCQEGNHSPQPPGPGGRPALMATGPGTLMVSARGAGYGGTCSRRSAGDLEFVANVHDPISHPHGSDHCVVFGPCADMAGQRDDVVFGIGL